jgi:HK97 family phage major capsid protein
MNYQELVRKADLALSDLTSHGVLNPEQENTFFRKVIDAPTILKECRFVPMAGPRKEINKIGFADRILKAANQGTISTPELAETGTRALTRANRTLPSLSKITLDTDELIAEINIPYEVLEDNIEKENLQSTMLDMIAEGCARDLEEKIILGDTTSADAYLALQNGILAATSSNTVNHGGAEVDVNLFKNMRNALPVRYHRFINDMRFYVSTTREVDMRAALAQRQTNLGDQMLAASAAISMMGVQVRGATQMPNANAILLNPKNLIVGIQRNMRMEMDKNIRERAIIIVLTMRMDHLFEEEDMVVKALNIG